MHVSINNDLCKTKDPPPAPPKQRDLLFCHLDTDRLL